jgi:prepilin peptidase CpaA
MPNFSAMRVLAAVVVIAAAVTDLRSRRIPNWLTLSGVCAGLLLNWYLSGLPGLWTGFKGLLLGFGVYFILYALRAMGAGDVKLMAAVGAIVGPANWFAVFIASSLAGGVLAVVLMVWKGKVRETLWNSLFIVGELARFRAPYHRRTDLDVKDSRSLKMPHGVAIAVGTLACLAFGVI